MKILVIGLGSIGKRHAENAKKYADEVAVYDQNNDAMTLFASENDMLSFNSIEDALSWGADGVVVATPHTTHIDLAYKAIDSGAHVLVEKPFSNTMDRVEECLAFAGEKQRKIFVVCNMRYHQAVKTLRDRLADIGEVMYVRAQYGNYLPNMRPDSDYKKLYCAHKDKGGGVIFDVVHEIDYLTWMFGAVTSVACEKDKRSDLDIDVEDYAEILLTHDSGVKCSIHMDYLQQCKRRGCEIIGSKGTLIWESEGKKPEHCRVRLYQSETKEWQTLYESHDQDNVTLYVDLMEAFTEEIQGTASRNELSTGGQGAQVLKVALAAHESAESGRKIILDENHDQQ